jgi:precorrin-2/cobalt-factor-2 C20-methyltransferase
VISLKFIIAGVGPGDPDMITADALRAIREADLVLIPHSHAERASAAEQIVRAHIPELDAVPLLFPMTSDAEKRDASLYGQLEALRPRWQGAQTVVLPVIGDSTLYSTGFYLYNLWKDMVPDLKLELKPGISAHNFAAALTGSFLAMSDEIFAVVSATAPRERIISALKAADSAALYKPAALKGALRETVEAAGPWKRILRADRAGLPGQKIIEGSAALEPPDEYLSVLLLWK